MMQNLSQTVHNYQNTGVSLKKLGGALAIQGMHMDQKEIMGVLTRDYMSFVFYSLPGPAWALCGALNHGPLISFAVEFTFYCPLTKVT